MVILGIDPGTATIGFGVIKKTKNILKFIDCGIITTSPKQSTGERLTNLHKNISSLIRRLKPDFLVVEKLYFFKNLKTALPVSEARGVILLAASQQKVKVIELTPLQIKIGICGYGRADKKQIQKMVKEILGLEKIPKPDDAADGLAAAICGACNRGG
ncbi:crossover junction endodeoxyribonuclease RuvC [bacterium (Candidatus Gribaldobacteria) CG08_land_8_20_14_0_20_39_15]|uniref:Crossover junction endodeoxyribonuclease RuvC n=1 Tax=bacterium (Candidatus Gribaldobacteria) CG08_land_8_20_14_0_20_39_15 TaxID=2014273 RepID=A0A2M6XV85_9BACT|nr:MAG: crossover junction endodeoxyribonuclease RuvC [bacterium (Candidatus Gribaldobacteria) CG08_land_8_20_14_0_20_39_15]